MLQIPAKSKRRKSHRSSRSDHLESSLDSCSSSSSESQRSLADGPNSEREGTISEADAIAYYSTLLLDLQGTFTALEMLEQSVKTIKNGNVKQIEDIQHVEKEQDVLYKSVSNHLSEIRKSATDSSKSHQASNEERKK